jgi:hypothetical protein
MKGRIRKASAGALWVFSPISGNWNALGYQMLSHDEVNGKAGTEFGQCMSIIIQRLLDW